MLRWPADYEHYDLLEALRPRGRGKSGVLDLPAVLKAKKEKDLASLKRRLRDPLLQEAVTEAAGVITYDNHVLGLRHLSRLAPAVAGVDLSQLCLSWLREPRYINRLVGRMTAEGTPRTPSRTPSGVRSRSCCSSSWAKPTPAESSQRRSGRTRTTALTSG